MERIHDNTPVLKTLFVIRAPKPGTEGWNTQFGTQLIYDSTVRIALYSRELLSKLLVELPYYIVKVHESDYEGYMRFDIEDNTVLNPSFDGVMITVELHPMYPLKHVLLTLHQLLLDLATDYEAECQLEFTFDEDYSWLGVQGSTVKQAPANTPAKLHMR